MEHEDGIVLLEVPIVSRIWRLAAVWMGLVVLVTSVESGSAAPNAAAEPSEVMVYAAASLRDVLLSLAQTCEGLANVRLIFNFGASNDLARQIMAANKADLFFSADETWMDKVSEEGLLDVASRRSLLSNRLVVVVPLDSLATLSGPAALAGPAVKRICLADPGAVPAGKYARAWLEKTGQWKAVKERIVPALDVRAVLAAVESGAVEAGVVYRTDAAISKKVRIVYEVPEGDGPRISYAIAVLKDRPHYETARRALDCLTGEQALRTFETYGFLIPGRSR